MEQRSIMKKNLKMLQKHKVLLSPAINTTPATIPKSSEENKDSEDDEADDIDSSQILGLKALAVDVMRPNMPLTHEKIFKSKKV